MHVPMECTAQQEQYRYANRQICAEKKSNLAKGENAIFMADELVRCKLSRKNTKLKRIVLEQHQCIDRGFHKS